MKTSELTNAALNEAVAEIENPEPTYYIDDQGLQWEKEYSPSTDWAQGGPILEREKICPCPSSHAVGSPWSATDLTGHITRFGPTPLIAAMRCYVASKLGDDIDVPKELL
jgi:hypothetical protein